MQFSENRKYKRTVIRFFGGVENVQPLIIIIVLLSISVAVLLVLLIMSCSAQKSITKQIKSIMQTDTNTLVRSEINSKCANELINEINSLLRELRDNRQYYKRKNHDINQMITNISHDLRTPLTSALGYINLIKNSELSEEEKYREIEIISQRLLRLEQLINSFFEFSRIISNNEPPEKEELNLIAILEESAAHYFDDFDSKNRSIELSCNRTKIPVYSNKNMLMRIFDNLIGNAYKHGSGNLNISVKITDDDKIIIVFSNNLVNADINIERIFDEFYTTDISRTSGNTGLGLAIAKQFTEIIGGKISADCKDENFSVALKLNK